MGCLQIIKLCSHILDDLRSGHRSLSVSSNLSSSIRCCWISIRTELVQKWSLLVRIRTIVERISICFFEPGDLGFRTDSGQIESDIGAHKTQEQQHKTREQLELLQQQAQPEAKLISLHLVAWSLASSKILSKYRILFLLVQILHKTKQLLNLF